MIAGDTQPAGLGVSTTLADIDFETYSEAGYYFDDDANRWKSITSSPPHGIGAVGAAAYSEHPSTEVLCLAFNLKDGKGPRLWLPSMAPPQELFDYLEAGGLVEAWNSSFEFYVWNNTCVRLYGWPPLDYRNLRDAMAKSRRHSLPGKLATAAKAVEVADLKIADGTRLLNKFSKPRQPTKKNAARRLRPEDDTKDAQKLYEYCLGDIKTESQLSAVTPDLTDSELRLWLLDQKINFRGVNIDRVALDACISIVEQATVRYNAELAKITDGACTEASKLPDIKDWLHGRGLHFDSLDKDAIEEALKSPHLDIDTHRVLEIRQMLGSASVKKVFAIARRLSTDGRLRDLFAYCGADRTGRFAGQGPQPQNLPAGGPKVQRCHCGRHSARTRTECPFCGGVAAHLARPVEWGAEAVEDALGVIGTRSLDIVEFYFGDALKAVSGCLRGLFVASEGHDLICSDYSAIEAVCLAMLSGEQWRIDVFKTHGKIYEMSASKITGIPFDEFERYKKENGEHHPMRKKVGKVAELASGYQGWVGAWIAFGADEHLNEDEIKQAVIAWRNASPSIVAMWGGLETAARNAIKAPGTFHTYRDIGYVVSDDVLYCKLPSGRFLSYHAPRLTAVERYGKTTLSISYMGFNTDYKKGPRGWLRLDTYGGKLTENVTQAVARDILTHGMLGLDAAGYMLALHVHDEAAADVRKGEGSVEEFERILSTMPDWAKGWPIKAVGGWRARRYRKD